jgi:nucleoside-diphosphate-sugar epimerase
MDTKNELYVVFGASGGIGNALVRELTAQGKHVRAVNRSGQADVPAGVEIMRGDAMDVASARQVCAGASVVFNCANVPYPEWEAKFPAIINGAIEGAASASAKLIFADNLYAYGPVSGLMTEDLPYNAPGHKGKLRAQLANTMMDAHKSGKVRVAIGRASDFYGANANAIAGDLVIRPILAGKKAMWVGNLDVPHSFSYLPDFARGLITLGERDEALGHVWHVPTAEPLTGRQYLQMVFEAAGLPLKIGVYSRWTMRLVALFSPMVREVLEELYQFESPFVMDTTKFATAFGAQVTPHREAIKQTLAWYRQHAK